LGNPEKLGHKIKIVSNAFGRIMNESMAEQGLTGAQAFILGYLARTPGEKPCQHELETRFHIKHPTATGLLARLREKGLVDFVSDEHDRRVKRVVITPAGLEHANSTREKLDATQASLTRGMTPGEIAELNRLLDLMVANTCRDGGGTQKGDDSK